MTTLLYTTIQFILFRRAALYENVILSFSFEFTFAARIIIISYDITLYDVPNAYSCVIILQCTCSSSSRFCAIKPFEYLQPRQPAIVRNRTSCLEGADITSYYVHNIMMRIIITLALKYSVIAAPIHSLSPSMSRLCRHREGWRDAAERPAARRDEVVHHAPPPASVPFSIN